jgi:Asp-tRNA(Asn)/Glu-tRNA(Gln) amidotransferase A subunit family amidase
MKPSRRHFLAASIAATASRLVSAPTQDFAGLTVKQGSELLRRKAATPVDLTEACLKRIDQLNPRVNAYITVTREQALAAAREMADEQRRGKWRGPLHGIPIALKDNIDTAGIRTTAASELFKDRIPTEDAEVARRLKNAGAILLGKTNMHEFAYGTTSAVTYFKPVHNPWALDRIPGGSSGGSAAATSADMCIGSLGTDTGGSVRIPASFCGVVGFKPTYGRVSCRGVIPLSWTLDHVGPICKTVEDAALMLDVIAGFDQMDPASADAPVPEYTRALAMPVAKLRLGLPRSPYFEGLDPEVQKAVEEAITVLAKLTAGASDVTPPHHGPEPDRPGSVRLSRQVDHRVAQSVSTGHAGHSATLGRQQSAGLRGLIAQSVSVTARDQKDLLYGGFADHADHAAPTGHHRSERDTKRNHTQHVAFRCLRASRDLAAVWFYQRWIADWSANQRRTVRRTDRARVSSRLRTSHRLAPAPACAIVVGAAKATSRPLPG